MNGQRASLSVGLGSLRPLHETDGSKTQNVQRLAVSSILRQLATTFLLERVGEQPEGLRTEMSRDEDWRLLEQLVRGDAPLQMMLDEGFSRREIEAAKLQVERDDAEPSASRRQEAAVTSVAAPQPSCLVTDG